MRTFWNNYKLLIVIGLTVFVCVLINKSCETPPSITTTTKIDIKHIVDSIKSTIVTQDPEKVYVEIIKTKWKKRDTVYVPKDSLIYVKVPSDTSIEANKFTTSLIANSAVANLSIITTGKLLDVKGTITYPKEIITNTIIERRNNSGGFLYGEIPISSSPGSFELGVDYHIKNKILTGISVDYNTLTNNTSINVKLGFKIF